MLIYFYHANEGMRGGVYFFFLKKSKYDKIMCIIYNNYKKCNNKNAIETEQLMKLFFSINNEMFNGEQKDASELLIQILENYINIKKNQISLLIFRRICTDCGNKKISKEIQFPIYIENIDNEFNLYSSNIYQSNENIIEMDCKKCEKKM